MNAGKIILVEHECLETEYRKYVVKPPTPLPARKAKPSLRVSEQMTRRAVTTTPSEALQSALEKMKTGHLRHLPVVEDQGRLVGMLSDRDVRLVYPSSDYAHHERAMQQFKEARVERAAVFSLVSVLHDASLVEAAKLMLRWEIGALPVISEDSRVVGIITNSDFLKEFVAREEKRFH